MTWVLTWLRLMHGFEGLHDYRTCRLRTTEGIATMIASCGMNLARIISWRSKPDDLEPLKLPSHGFEYVVPGAYQDGIGNS